ncbi:MAG: SPOR domain-containing protein [Chitinophagaceae bacterium]|nr:MAG: SPOR domain-containing protein [Chitinophagaceae bacterium]
MILFFGLLISMFEVSAQSDTSSVVVKKDPRIDLLVKKQIEANEIVTRNLRRSAAGFRILVINTTDRAKALEAKTKIYQAFPELKSYLIFQSPKFHLKVGNFKERADAEAYLENIKQSFPSGVYVVRDTIEVNPAPTNDSTMQ